jgi:amino acid adenylation domain-containing protein
VLGLGGVTGTPVPLFTGRTRTDLALTLTQDRGGYAGSLDYAAELYDRPTASTVAATFTALLGEIVSRPDTPAGDLRLVRRPPARSVPPRARAVPPPAGAQRQGSACPAAHELFRRQARSTPAAAALRWDGGELSYAGLDQAAARMAARLRAACPPGSLVAVCARRAPALAVALLAVLRAGSGYLPLDPAYPRERLDFMLRDSGAPLLLCDNDLAGTVTLPPGVRQLTLADDPGDSPPGDAPPAETVTPDSLCYVIYTSGSTGEPRGVEMPHGPLANLLDWQARASAAGPGWRTLQFAPFSFDVAFQELFSTWATGGTLVLIDDDTRRDPKLLLDYLGRQGVHRLFLPFVALQSLAESACGLRRFPRGLREVVTAGEQLLVTPAIREFFRETGASLENQYGPSETHVVTAERLTGAPEGWPDVPAIGTPVTGAVVEVLDPRGHRLPPGVPGELWVSGPVLALGYRRRPDITAERFVTGPDGRRYRTGDIGRAGPDGRLYYLGRDDGQVKVRGHRVELGEVEASLKALPGVADAVVTVGERGRGGRQLTAHCVLADGAGLTTRELREGLARRLPGYLVPASFAVLPAFPLLPSGKVDRRALASAPVPAADGAAAAVRPRDAIELQLCGIWREVLGLPSVGVHDDFFELGGDSFAGVRMIAAIRRLLGTEIALADLLSNSTVEALARAVRAGGTPIAASPLVQLQPGDGTTPVYAFHPLPGTVMRYAAFARALGSGQAVWGLQSVGLQPGETPLRTVSEMAETYLRHMRGVHPGGPWHLVGYSMGGTVAVEVARRLRQAGEPVGLVGLFDTSAAFDLDAGTDYSTRILVRMGLKINIDIERLLALDPAARTSELLSRSIEAGTLPADYDADRLRRMLDMYQHNGTALAAHRVRPYDGRVVVFRAENGRPGPVTEAPDLGWGTLAGEVVVHEVPGDHYLMMEGAQVGALARLVAGYLRDVRPEVREPAEVSR